MNLSGHILDGVCYVGGGALSFIAANIFLPHDLRAWIAFGAGFGANTLILLFAYRHDSKKEYRTDKVITSLDAPGGSATASVETQTIS